MSKIFIKAVEIGIKHKFPHWDSTNVGILGMAMADLLLDRLNYELYTVKFDDKDVDKLLMKLMKLSFIFLSRRLEITTDKGHEVYQKRAVLLQDYSAALYGEQRDCKDEIISDHFISSLLYTKKGYKVDAEKEMDLAKSLYKKYTPDSKEPIEIDDVFEVVKIGKLKNNKLYDKLLKEYSENELEIKKTEFEEYFWNNKGLVAV